MVKFENDNIAMFTTLNDKHIMLFEVFIKSFLHFNPWFNFDFVILDIGLSESNKKLIKSYYKKVIFKQYEKDEYKGVNFKKTHAKLRPTYYKLDAFKCGEYRKVVSIDMDMLVLGDMREVFKAEGALYACQAYNQNKDCLQNSINSGLFVIPPEYLNRTVYRSLIKAARCGHSMPDQKTINKYFTGRIRFFPKKYNVEKRVFKTKNPELIELLKEIVVWHFIADKPYEDHIVEKEKGFDEIENLWRDWYNK